MINLRTANKYLYWEPGIREIHLLGQFLDAFLFLYLIWHFFEPKKNIYRKPAWKAGMVLLFTFILSFTDWIFHNNFYTYCVAMVAVPMTYLFFFYNGDSSFKILVCVIFFSLMNALEGIPVALNLCLTSNAFLPKWIWVVTFFIRRVVLKAVLYFLLRVLMLDIIRKCTYIRKIYWYYLGAVCIAAYILPQLPRHLDLKLWDYAVINLVISISSLALICAGCRVTGLIMQLDDMQKQKLIQKTAGKAQMKDLTQMTEMQETFRKLRHDYKAHLFAINALVEQKEYDKLHHYLAAMHESIDNLTITAAYTDSNVLNLFLTQKEQEASRAGVSFQAISSLELEPILDKRIQLYDLISLLSNLCDNAIESAARVPGGSVRLTFSRKKSYLKIQTDNSTDSNVLQENPQFATTKKDQMFHGFGTRIIMDIIEKYDGIRTVSGSDHNLSIQILLKTE